METLKRLENLAGHGTSMITITVGVNPRALDKTIEKLRKEFSAADQIKSRV